MIDDYILRDIFLDAAAEEYADELASTDQIATSLRFQNQIDKLLKKSRKWGERNKKTLWKRCGQSVAVFLFVCSLTLGTIMLASPTVRAAVVEWIIEWYDTHIIYRFSEKPDIETVPEYEITELPSGYVTPGEEQELVDGRAITYENDNGDTIYFEYVRVESGSALMIRTEDVELLEVEVNGYSGHIYLSEDLSESNAIVWYDEQKKIQFMIDGFVEQEDLLWMANSVSLCKTTK